MGSAALLRAALGFSVTISRCGGDIKPVLLYDRSSPWMDLRVSDSSQFCPGVFAGPEILK